MYKSLKELITEFPSWNDLSKFLKSSAGGALQIIENAPFALIRYQKGVSNFSVPHVKVFRSVVWNIETHRPVSVTPFKSETGESLPTIESYVTETFMDGVLIGQYWDGTSWKIHTRSTLGATCRYYSTTTSFNTWVEELMTPDLVAKLDPTVCYSWILQHPENRIVCYVGSPRLILVGAHRIEADGTIVPLLRADLELLNTFLPNSHAFSSIAAMQSRLLEWNDRYRHNFQGFVFRDVATGRRWKIRTEAYTKARLLRDNNPRSDYVWLNHWKAKTLSDYLDIYPEERLQARTILARWKQITFDLFNIYNDKFKSRSSPEVPQKFRGILHHMHLHYYNVLKPENKTLTLPEAIQWMNERNVPLMLHLINYELREAIATVEEIPVEPMAAAAAAPAAPGAAAAPAAAAPAEAVSN
jgi:hypothetical protein